MSIPVRIDSLAHGPAAVGRHEGKVFFVPGAAPGDLARIEIEQDHGRWSEGRMVELLEAGAARVDAPCPIASECGGCPWQHVDYGTQLRAKQSNVAELLSRIGAIPDPPVHPIVPSPSEFGYRNRLKLRFADGRLGFYRAGSNALVPVSDCLLGQPDLREALPRVEGLVARLATRITRVEVASGGELPGLTLALNAAGRFEREDARVVGAELAAAEAPVRGVWMWGRGWHRQWGDTRRRERSLPDGDAIETSGASFGQVNPQANRALVATVVELATGAGGRRILELYAGAGNFSVPLARRAARVVAVEQDLRATESARRTAEAAGIDNLELVTAATEAYLRTPSHAPHDVLVLDPPRGGLGRSAGAAAGLGIGRIVYVSCNPATLARDAAVFAEAGYRLLGARPFDLFPQTFHVESVCDFELT